MIILVGCQSDPKAKNFSVTVAAPEDLRTGELFILTSTLVNHSDNPWDVQHGADMFTYDVFDSNSDRVPQGIEPLIIDVNEVRGVDSIGFTKTLEPKEQFSYNGEEHVHPNNNEYILPAGSYTIVSTAKFRIKQDGIDYEFEIESEPISIKVS